jgi:hypothetical protein
MVAGVAWDRRHDKKIIVKGDGSDELSLSLPCVYVVCGTHIPGDLLPQVLPLSTSSVFRSRTEAM